MKFLNNIASLSLSGCKGLEEFVDWIELGEEKESDTLSVVEAGNWTKALASSTPLHGYGCCTGRPLGLSSSSLSPTANLQLESLVKADWLS